MVHKSLNIADLVAHAHNCASSSEYTAHCMMLTHHTVCTITANTPQMVTEGVPKLVAQRIWKMKILQCKHLKQSLSRNMLTFMNANTLKLSETEPETEPITEPVQPLTKHLHSV